MPENNEAAFVAMSTLCFMARLPWVAIRGTWRLCELQLLAYTDMQESRLLELINSQLDFA